MTRRLARTAVPIAVAVAVALLPLVVTDRFILKVLTLAAIDVIVVTGLALLFGYAGQVSLGHAAFVGLGAYASAITTVTLGWPWLGGVAAGAVVAGLGGFVLALPALRLRGHYLAMATLGFGEIAYIAVREAEGLTGGQNGFTGIAPPEVAGAAIMGPGPQFLLVWGVAGLALLLAYGIVGGRPGRAMRALHGSEAAAQASGVDTVRLKVQVFTLSAALAGVAGSLYAHVVGFISPALFSLGGSVQYLAKTILGGTASLVGPAVSAVALRLVENLNALLPWLPREASEAVQGWLTDVYGLTIIVVMLFAPRGLAGLGRTLSGRLRREKRVTARTEAS